MTKHYIRVDENNNIIKVFSDEFEQPENSDILLRDNATRQFYFEFTGGERLYNPSLKDNNNCYLYAYDGKKVLKKQESEIKSSIEYKESKFKELRAKRNGFLNRCDVVYCNADRWENYTEEEKETIRNYKQKLRDLPEQNENPDLIEFPELVV